MRTASAALLALALCSRPAFAHGGLFRADELRIDPADPSHWLVRSDVWGLVETHDRGKTFEWTCAAAPYGDDLKVLREPLVMLGDGTVLVGSTESGVIRSTGSRCAFEIVPFFQGSRACNDSGCSSYDIAAESPDGTAAIVLTVGPAATGGLANVLWRSSDDGASWTSMSTSLPTDVFATSVAVAPSDPSTLYVGSSNTKATYYLHRSSDGGRTFENPTLVVTLGADEPLARVRFHAIHPTDPLTVFVWLDADVGDPAGIAPDRLFASFDGGRTVAEVYRSENDLPGFALAPDGATVFVGGTDEGLWSASMDDLKAGKTDAFHQVNPGGTWSLAFTDRGLLAGREEFPKDGGVQPMTLGLSTDRGLTFESAMSICDVHLANCAQGTRAGDVCPNLYYGDYNFQYDQQRVHCASAPKPKPEAGTTPTPPAPPPRSEGCSCRSAAAGSNDAAALGASAAALSILFRRTARARAVRRRRTSRRTN